MPPISFKAIAIAFTAEIGVDILVGLTSFGFFARGLLEPGMTDTEIAEVTKTVLETTAYLPWMMLTGTATTLGGGYLAARLARRIPYYHGLAMGIAGILLSLVLWPDDADWMTYLGLVITIPVSLYGAHLAKRHMEAAGPDRP